MREIFTALDGVVDGLHHAASAVVHGRGSFWPGPLDPQALAVSSVGLAAASAEEFARRTGRRRRTVTARLPEVIAAFESISRLRIDGHPVAGFAPCSGFFPTADGWLRTHANYPHHRARLFEALGIDDDDALAPALAQLSSLEAESRIVRAGGVAAAVRDEAEWRRDATSTPGPWIDVQLHPADVSSRTMVPRASRGPWRAAPPPRDAALPLEGMRVVSLTRVIAGPTAAKFLAALGADVLRIDPPTLPELLGQHLDTDLGVRCASRDLSSPSSASEVTEALDSADVLLTGYRPGSLTALGLGAVQIRERFPHLVHVELSAWEPSGPRAGQRGFDSIVQAATGVAAHYGGRDDDGVWRPSALPVQALDHATGYGMAAAACALLASGHAGHARLSLERTARVLLDAGHPHREKCGEADLDSTTRSVTLTSAHGMITCVPAPVRVDGRRPPVAPPIEC